VLRAAVPEAAVHEDRDASGAEDDVDGAPPHARNGDVDSVPQAGSMEKLAYRDFWPRVAGTLTTHTCGGSGGRWGDSRHRGIVPAVCDAVFQPEILIIGAVDGRDRSHWAHASVMLRHPRLDCCPAQ
jgi:hypothetical protein